jgi:hypothetical protein
VEEKQANIRVETRTGEIREMRPEQGFPYMNLAGLMAASVTSLVPLEYKEVCSRWPRGWFRVRLRHIAKPSTQVIGSAGTPAAPSAAVYIH